MNPTANLVYKTANNTLNYINNAISYVISLDYYCSVTYDGKLRSDNLPEAVFILTSETSSSFISEDQFRWWMKAREYNIPIYIIYRLKDTAEFNVYTAKARQLKSSGRSKSNHAHISDFKRTSFDSYYEQDENRLQFGIAQIGDGSIPVNPYDPSTYLKNQTDAGFSIDRNELLLLVK